MSKSPVSEDFHDSAKLHVTGRAIYVDDIPVPSNCLHILLGMSRIANGKIMEMELNDVKKMPGIIDVITAKDIPGKNDASPIFGDDPIFAESEVIYNGQVIFAVIAESLEHAKVAIKEAKIVYSESPPIITLAQARHKETLLCPPKIVSRGDFASSINHSDHIIEGEIVIGGQEHFYLEGQAALAVPKENKDFQIFVSSQHPSEIQHKVADVLGLSLHNVSVEVRRMGGAFGGKESQANLPACIVAIAAQKTGKPCKLVYDRDDDMRITGKRHDFISAYKVGFDVNGVINALRIQHDMRCGMSMDLSAAIAERALMHSENSYYIPNVEFIANLYKTNTPSNTAFRGFGGPQGMLAMERVIDEIAHFLKLDPLTIRKRNFYLDNKNSIQKKQQTPYGQFVKDCIINDLVNKLEYSSNYLSRRKEIERFNKTSNVIKRGIALTPVKFGISFNKLMLNQAGALVNVYSDGSVYLNHGGTEMGQGLFTKVRKIVADTFGILSNNVKISATDTNKVPNTSATAASSGTDLNGMAAYLAAFQIKERMAAYLGHLYQCESSEVIFSRGKIIIFDEEKMTFSQAAEKCWMGRISLSSTGFYKTPDIYWDAEKGEGRPFYYFVYGAAVSEIVIDKLTGESRVVNVDILHDVGRSINPSIDKGQIEGGFVQGLGWLSMEELVYGNDGTLMTHSPATYKIPAFSDSPINWNVEFYKGDGNIEETINRSKAVGEPPFMLAMSVFFAYSHALTSLKESYPSLNSPATAERLYFTQF